MSRWKKGLLLVGLIFTSLLADDCGVFLDVLQTRNPNSQIVMKGDAHITDTSAQGCELNTTAIVQGEWYRQLYCGNGRAEETGVPASSIEVNYNYTVEEAQTDATPCEGECPNREAYGVSKVYPEPQYGQIKLRGKSWGDPMVIDFTNDGDKYINKIFINDPTLNINFKNQTGNVLKIGKFESTGWGNGLNINLDGPASDIYIDNFSANNKLNITFEAQNTIQMGTFQFPRYNSVMVLKAPKIIIDNFIQTNKGSETSKVIIYADEVDISNKLDLGQHAILEVHPYTSGRRVQFKAKHMIASSSSSIISDNADFYTDEFDIPGTDHSASIRASDANQIINLYINGDFAPGNNPGINTDTRHPNSYNLPAANFRMFVNGDFNIGNGGTAFNAVIYVEGTSRIGTEFILHGALSSGDNIEIANGAQFGWDESIDDMGNVLCGGEVEHHYNYLNRYSCNIFKAPLISYGHNIEGGGDKVIDSCQVATSYSVSGMECYSSVNSKCKDGCKTIDQPKNRLDYSKDLGKYVSDKENTLSINENTTLTDQQYGNIVVNSGTLHLAPSKSYEDNERKVMVAKTLHFANEDEEQPLILESGDYFFDTIKVDGRVKLCINGDVRIFIKGDLILDATYDNSCSGSALIYVEGNSYITATDSISKSPIYVYTKGETEIDRDSDHGYWYGAIASEGGLKVTQNNIDFIYDKDGAETLGYGECKICYTNIKAGGFGMDMFCMGSMGMFKSIDVPIRATEALEDVEIDELHNKNLFTFNFLSNYLVKDQDNQTVREAETVSDGFSFGAMGMVDMGMFGGKAIKYKLGDNDYNYGPTTPEQFQRLYSSSMFSMDMNMCMWLKSLVYVGHYDDKEGRHYDIVMEKCSKTKAGEQEAVTGVLDGWSSSYKYVSLTGISYDSYGIPNKRILTTEIVNQPIDVKVAFIPNNGAVPSDSGTIEAKVALVKMEGGKFDPYKNLLSDWGYYRYDSGNPVTHFRFVPHGSTSGSNIALSKLDGIEDARLMFKVCSNYDGNKYTVYPLESCADTGDCENQTEQGKICYRYFTSSDNFAIRPYGLRIFGKNEYRRAGEEFNLTLKGVDQQNYEKSSGKMEDVASVTGYEPTLNQLQFIPSFYKATQAEKQKMRNDMGLAADAQVDYCPNSGQFQLTNGENQLTDGEGNVSLKYSEVGILDLNVTEQPGEEFAKVDADDTKDSRRYIKPAVGITDVDNISKKDLLLIIPYRFVTTGDYSTTFGTPWVYISRDVNNSNSTYTTPEVGAVATYHIVAQNKGGQVVKNFTKTCFPDFQTTAPKRNGLKLNVTFDLFLDAHLQTSTEVNQMAFYTEDGNGKGIYTPNKLVDLPAGKKVIKEWISSLNFNNGIGDAKVYFNQIKDYRTPVEPYTVKVIDLNTSTSWMDNPGATQVFVPAILNKEVEFRYGRLKVENLSTYGNKITTDWLYQYYIGGKWKTNSDHTTTQMGHFYTDKSLLGEIDVNELSFDKGDSQIKLSTAHQLPYSYKVHLAIDPWLWYHPNGKDYKDPVTPAGNNFDCLTHPCFIVEFMENSSGWSGVENKTLQNKGMGTEKNTVKVNREVNGSVQHFQRLNW